MTERDRTTPPSGHERRVLMRTLIGAGIVLFVFLIAYFTMFGPFGSEDPANRAVAPNVELENKATPLKQPETP